jgi:hydroxypyruvate isomerase
VTVRFSVNVSILFTELPLLERFDAAAAAGFRAVEMWWPRGEDIDAVRAAAEGSGCELVLLNFDAGDMPAGDRGLVGDLERHEEFRSNVPVALELARSLGCRRLNALAGTERPGQAREEQLALAAENVRWAADHAARQGAEVLIEPVNRLENGPYLFGTTAQAVEFIDDVGRPNVRLQYDAYHAQRAEGNLTATLREHIRRIAHVQIADSPDRHEPGTGEINYRFLLLELLDLGYEGHVGLEYKPRESTEASLGWLAPSLRAADIDPDAIFGGPVGAAS